MTPVEPVGQLLIERDAALDARRDPAILRWQIVGHLMSVHGTADIPNLLRKAQQIADYIETGSIAATPVLEAVKK